jgi:hypothetical protein
MGWGVALSKIPWKHILPYIPTVVDTARELLGAAKKTEPAAVATAGSELGDRVAQLEANERKQAELVQTMAEQQEQLATSIRILESRVKLLFILVLALLIALVAMLVFIFLHTPVR